MGCTGLPVGAMVTACDMTIRLRNHSVFRSVVFAVALTVMLTSDGSDKPLEAPGQSEFYFVRLAYSENGMGFGGRQAWTYRYARSRGPPAPGIRRLTRIDTSTEGQYMSIMDKRLFDYPGSTRSRSANGH